MFNQTASKRAALNHHALAQHACVRYQLRCSRDLIDCLAFCEQLVAKGDESLRFVLARLLDTGIAGKTDKVAAYGHYSVLASNSHPLACYYYALILENQQNFLAARQYYEAAPAHHIEAKFRLACLLLEEADKNSQPTQAQRIDDLDEIELEGSACMPRRKENTLFSRTNTRASLTADQTKAISLLAFYYHHYHDEKPTLLETLDNDIERLLSVKPAIAIRADNAYPAQANYWLGKIVDEGKGVAIDGRRALEYYQRAAATNPDASYRMGYIYESGLGVPKNWALAKRFYQSAADRGHELASKRLSWSYALFSGPTPDDATLRQASNCIVM